MVVTCPVCGQTHDCQQSAQQTDSPVLPCSQFGDIRVHIVDEVSYRNIQKPVKTFLTGASLPGKLEATTDGHGVAAYTGLKPGTYTVWLSPLSEDILKTHRLPATDYRDLTVYANEVAYVPFLLPRAPKWLRLQLFDLHVPRAAQSFTLQLASGSGESLGAAIQGKTDADGILEQEVNATSASAVIVIGPDKQTIQVTLRPSPLPGGEDGHRMRLAHLGYGGAASPEEWTAAILTFERDHGLPATGTCEGPTLAKLLEVHDQKFTYTDSRK